MADLLPAVHNEFSSKSYWQSFFQQRTDAFEWYGEYKDMQGLIRKYLPRREGEGSRVLVVGCGNSDFSAHLYEDGYFAVTNIDFSEVVIEEMEQKHRLSHPQMLWKVMDMTDMQGVEDESTDAMMDKGALDALMSEDTEGVRLSAQKMMREVSRVLLPGGYYMCVTLAQGFILKALLSGMAGWTVELHALITSKKSPFLPFVVVAKKPNSGVGDKRHSADSVFSLGTNVIHESTATAYFDALGVVSAEGARLIGQDEISKHIQAAQEVHKRRYDLSFHRPGRYEEEHLWSKLNTAVPRYTLLILDTNNARTSALRCAVVIIPRGRELDFAFNSEEGLLQVAESANARRLIAVRLNRGHEFKDYDQVKAELGPMMMGLLSPESEKGAVPIMAVDSSLGDSATCLAEGSLACAGTGGYVVEELQEEGGKLRRLVFLSNQGVVQTEVRLVDAEVLGAVVGAHKTKKNKAGKKGKKKKGSGKASNNVKPTEENNTKERELVFQYLCFHYHKIMVAAMVLSDVAATVSPTALVIGLGGGALPMALRQYFPNLSTVVCELDAEIAGLAKEWFGFEETKNNLEVVVQDGLDFVKQGGDHRFPYSGIFIDVDTKDTSVGMSCPPAAFVEGAFLLKLLTLLREDGLLAINIAARSKKLYKEVLGCICSAVPLGQVYEVKASDDDVNTTVLIRCTPRTAKGPLGQQLQNLWPTRCKSKQVAEMMELLDKATEVWCGETEESSKSRGREKK
ncbi:unnamed protein product [Chrysoparadoxa australica]